MKYIKYIYKRTEKKLSFLSSVAEKSDSKGVFERFNSFIKTFIDERILSLAAKSIPSAGRDEGLFEMRVCNSFEAFVTACNRICNGRKPHNKAVVTDVTVFSNSLSEKREIYIRGYIKRCIYIKISAEKLLQPLQRDGYAAFSVLQNRYKALQDCYTSRQTMREGIKREKHHSYAVLRDIRGASGGQGGSNTTLFYRGIFGKTS